MSVPEAQADERRRFAAEHASQQHGGPPLPPVTPPTATFLLQLFLIPLLIVSIIVVLWLLFSWVAHMGRDNAAELAKAVVRGDATSWQRAYELADLLRSPDPKYAAFRSDPALAKGLADFLMRDLAEPLPSNQSVGFDFEKPTTYSGSQAPRFSDLRERIVRRMYLCRSLGSFTVLDGLPALLKAAEQENDPVEVQVRFSAIEAIATLADSCGPKTIAELPDAMAVIMAASREANDTAPPPRISDDGEPSLYRPHAELRAVAAFALGVIGGEEAITRLEAMLHDTYPNARYNAATGLARAGKTECIRVLREMLDPENTLSVKDEINPNDQARKRTTVLLNGLKSTLQLHAVNPDADLSSLKQSIQTLADAPLTNVTVERSKVKAAAKEAVRLLESR